MQKSGRARADQAAEMISMWKTEEKSGAAKGKHTQSNDVAEPAKLAQEELAALHLGSALEHGHGDGGGIREGQGNDTHAGKGVERYGRSKVDGTQNDLNRHGQHHGVEGNIQLGVDHLPPLGTGDGTVASKGPRAARSSGCAGGTAKDTQNHDGNQEGKGTPFGANGRLKDGRDRLCQLHHQRQVGKNKHERHEEQEPANGVDEDGNNHGLGDLGGGMLDLLAHGDDHTGRRGGIPGVKEADHERPAGRPAGGGLKVGEGVFGGAAAFLGNGEDGNEDGKDAGEGPEHGKGL